jgi:hypothetical protein
MEAGERISTKHTGIVEWDNLSDDRAQQTIPQKLDQRVPAVRNTAASAKLVVLLP